MNYIINGGNKLAGELPVYSAKNCLLVLLAASVLTEEKMTFTNCTRIADVDILVEILEEMGATVVWQGDAVEVDNSSIKTTVISERLFGKMRGSVFLLGSLLGRLKSATAFEPGGCAIGKRPIDIHIAGLKSLGVSIEEVGNKILCNAENAVGGNVFLRFPSVGATENLIMCAVLTKGTTVLHNCAKEPEVVALCQCLLQMGAKISGIGQSVLTIEGVSKLHGTTFSPIPDRIVAATYLTATAIAGGDCLISNCNPLHLTPLLKALKISGCDIVVDKSTIRIKSNKKLLSFQKIVTGVYPQFPTDMQSFMLSLASICKGETEIVETLFENRLSNNANELSKMGANIVVEQNTAKIVGVKELFGATVKCCDLRGGAGLVLAGISANGTTVVEDIRHIERGYCNLDVALCNVGADIKRQS